MCLNELKIYLFVYILFHSSYLKSFFIEGRDPSVLYSE